MTTNTEKKRILMVHDLPSDSQLVKRYLEQARGHLVMEENDALAALDTAGRFQPDLVILDVLRPGMDGGELAARLQESPRLKAVPVVFLTAKVTREQADDVGGRIGNHRFLAKPIILTQAKCVTQCLGE